MKPLLLAFALAILGSVIYHTGQKLVPPSVHPLVLLMGAYAVAIALAALALPWVQPAGAWREALADLATGPNLRAALVLGVGVLLIEVGFLLEPHALRVEIVDDGTPFNPLEREGPDTSLPVEKRPVGGLGVMLVRHLVDEIAWDGEGGRNRVRLCKRLDG